MKLLSMDDRGNALVLHTYEELCALGLDRDVYTRTITGDIVGGLKKIHETHQAACVVIVNDNSALGTVRAALERIEKIMQHRAEVVAAPVEALRDGGGK